MRPVLSSLVGLLVVICIGHARGTVTPDCPGSPLAPGDGRWPASCVNGTLSQTCNAICDKPNFTAVNVPVISCTAAGWQYAPGSPLNCAKVCTGALPTLSNGVWGTVANSFCNATIGFGETCIGTCDATYVGSPTVQCLNGWAEVVGACAPPGGCAGTPPAVTSAAWPSDCRDQPAGTVCTAACNSAPRVLAAVDGNGNPTAITATCTAGAWVVNTAAPTKAMCIPTCGTPPAIAGITWGACANVSLPQGVCQGTCAVAGESGSPSITCVSGAWSDVDGACAPPGGCSGEPPAVTNTVPPTCTNRGPGATCTYSCKANKPPTTFYGPTDPAGVVSTCTAGQWSTPAAICTTVCPTAPPAVAGITWGTADNANCTTSIPLKGVCRGTCDGGYTGSPNVTCLGSTWSAVSEGCAPVGGCAQNPKTISNANPPSCAGANNGGVCTYTCRDLPTGPLTYGPASNVPPTATCTSGAWGSFTSSCVSVCRAPPPLVNGTWINNCANTRVSGVCAGTCSAGSLGAPTVKCLNGGWSVITGGCSATPVCTGLPTVPPTNGYWSATCNPTAFNNNCTITCNPGRVNGTLAVACVANATNTVTGADWATSGTGSPCK